MSFGVVPVTMASMRAIEQPVAMVGSAALREELLELRAGVADEGRQLLEAWRPALRRRAFLSSALDLAHYISLRRRDQRVLQQALMPLGLSSPTASRFASKGSGALYSW
jgi:hypothetical protein